MRLASIMLALGAASTAVYFAAGWGWTYVTVGLVTTVAMTLCARSVGWVLIAASNGLATAGDLAYYAYNHGYPSAADLLYLLSYAFLILAVVVFSRRAGGDVLSGRLLDVLIVATGAATWFWTFAIDHYVSDHAPLVQKAVSISYPALDLVVMAVLVRLLLAGVRAAWAHLLLAAIACALLADLVYGQLTLTAAYHDGSWIDAFWLGAYLLFAAAAIAALARPNDPPPRPVPHLRAALLVLAILAGPSAIVLQTLRHRHLNSLDVAGLIALTSLLVLLRLGQLVRAARRSEERYRSLVRDLDAMVWEAQYAPLRYTFIGPRTSELLGWPLERLLENGFWDSLIHPECLPYVERRRAALRDGDHYQYEYRVRRSDGRYLWLRVVGHLENGIARGVSIDVTAQKEARLEAEHSLSLLRATLEATADGILVVDHEGWVTMWNERFLDIWDLSEADLRLPLAERTAVTIGPKLKDQAGYAAGVAAIYADPEAEAFDLLELVDGRFVERATKPQRTGGEIVGRVWSFRDVTDQRHAEEERRESQRRFQETLEKMSLVAVGLELDGTISFVNDALLELSGWERYEVIGRNWRELFVPEDRDASGKMELFFDRLRSAGELPSYLNRIRLRSGEQRTIAWRDTALLDSRGEVTGAICIGEDVTERSRAETALRESEGRFRSLIEHSSDLISIMNADGTGRYLSPSHERVLGYLEHELEGTVLRELVHPDDRATTRASVEAAHAAPARPIPVEFRFRHADGSYRTLRGTVTNLIDVPGVEGLVVNSHDVTELLASEERLRHAQKLDAVGQLAGGIAHDFNNLLTAITGYSQFLLEGLPDPSQLRNDAEEIDRAASRAAALTRQLLAFSRRQVLQPREVNLNELVTELQKLLVRLIGEHIHLDTELEDQLAPVRADPGQLEQVIVNLVVNSRDAMPEGGSLRIETANEDGRVRLTVEDAGVGMDEETLSHLFEPFFTTKEQGKGTGLGLATVYGIVEQSGGEILVRSEPGLGTRVDVFLPAAVPVEEPPRRVAPGAGQAGWETVLLVEDEPMVRDLARSVLVRQGYHVLEVPGGAAALELAAGHDGRIDLMVTDVVMPQMSGRELAERMRGVRPEMRVLYTSGYDEEAIERYGLQQDALTFLPKPFTPDALASRVRDLLDQRA